MRIKGDQSTTRQINRRLVLDCLRRGDAVSRIDLVGQTGLSPAAISGVVGELKEEGFVIEGAAGKSSGGRKPIPLSINFGFRVSIGIKLMHDRIDAVLTDLSTAALDAVSVEVRSTDPREMLRATIEATHRLLPKEADRAERLLGIGIAMPGFIDADHGICLSAARLGWQNVPFASQVAAATGKPVWLENDVNAYAIAQNLFGLSRLSRSSLVIILGTGVGAALIIDGQIHRGGRFMAGEIGYSKDPSGDSFSALFSEPSLERDWATLSENAGTDLQSAVAADDPTALAFLQERGFQIGGHIAGMVNLIDPDVVVIGGEATRFGPAYYGHVLTALKSCVRAPLPHIEIDIANDIWTRGAAALAIQSFFNFESVAGTRNASAAIAN
jgi:predicted NBD/HSP70 family sugar kinase